MSNTKVDIRTLDIKKRLETIYRQIKSEMDQSQSALTSGQYIDMLLPDLLTFWSVRNTDTQQSIELLANAYVNSIKLDIVELTPIHLEQIVNANYFEIPDPLAEILIESINDDGMTRFAMQQLPIEIQHDFKYIEIKMQIQLFIISLMEIFFGLESALDVVEQKIK